MRAASAKFRIEDRKRDAAAAWTTRWTRHNPKRFVSSRWLYGASDETVSGGKYTPWLREIYTIYRRIYQTVERAMKPGLAPRDIHKAALVRMDSIVAAFPFTDPKIKAAAERMVVSYRKPRNSLGQMIGMESHDVTRPYGVLQPGMVFSLELALTIPDERG
jgi:Xaa-Pro aminopeptidase